MKDPFFEMENPFKEFFSPRCSFCQRTLQQVKKIIKGRGEKGVYICNACLDSFFNQMQKYPDVKRNLIISVINEGENEILSLTVEDFLKKLNLPSCTTTLKELLLAYSDMSEKSKCRKEEAKKREILAIDKKIKRMKKAIETLEEEKLELQQG